MAEATVTDEVENETKAAGKRATGQNYKSVISVAVTPEMYDQLVALQKTARMPSLSALVRMLLEDYVENLS